MKKLVLALAATTFMSTAALAEDIKIGVFLGFTGPIESTVANMGPGAELAIKEVSDSGALLDGIKVKPCAATPPVSTRRRNGRRRAPDHHRQGEGNGWRRLLRRDRCSPAERGAPNGIVMISPSATSPGCRRRRRRPVFPHRPVGCAPGRDRARHPDGKGRRSPSRSPTPTTTTARVLPTPSRRTSKPHGGKVTINVQHTKTARVTTPRKSARWRKLAVKCSWWLVTSTRAARASSRPRSTPARSTPSTSRRHGRRLARRTNRLWPERVLRCQPRHRQPRRATYADMAKAAGFTAAAVLRGIAMTLPR
jgi:hypothetical protein